MEIKVEEQKKELDERRLSSICWDCQNAYAHKCSWFRDYTPVKGWTAKKEEYMTINKKHFTYCVLECPNFVADEKQPKTKTVYKKRQKLKIMDKV